MSVSAMMALSSWGLDVCPGKPHPSPPSSLHGCGVGVVTPPPHCVVFGRYVEGEVSAREMEMQQCNYFDGLNWEKTISGKQFIFFQVCGCGSGCGSRCG